MILEAKKGFETSTMMVWINYGMVQKKVYENTEEARKLCIGDVNGYKSRHVKQLEVFHEELSK